MDMSAGYASSIRPGTSGVGLPNKCARASVNDGRRLSDRPLDIFGLPLLVALVRQVAAVNGGFDLSIRHSVCEGVNCVCKINAGAVASVSWIRAKAVDPAQRA